MTTNPWMWIPILFLLAGPLVPAQAQRIGYPPEEFITRREALCDRLESGTVLMFGNTQPALAARNHQDHDFYYLTGNEDLNSVLVLDVEARRAHLFLPKQGAGEIRSDGENWLEDPKPQSGGASSPSNPYTRSVSSWHEEETTPRRQPFGFGFPSETRSARAEAIRR